MTDTERSETYAAQMEQLAQIGATLCFDPPGAGDPQKWPTARCECRFASRDLSVLVALGMGMSGNASEITGCAEVRQAWRVLAMLRERLANVDDEVER
jgi:hypothetical protein